MDASTIDMKRTGLIAVGMLALGFGIGWAVRDAREQTKPAVVAQAAPKKENAADTAPEAIPPASERRAGRAETSVTLAESVKVSTDGEGDPEINRHVSQFMDAVGKRQLSIVERHLQSIEGTVPLTEEQKQRVADWLAERADRIKDFDTFALSQASGGSVSDSLSEQGLETFLEGVLDDSQKEDFDSFRDRNRAAKADALALKNLSKLQQVVDFTGDQRDRVYEILLQDAESRNSDAKTSENLSAFMHEGMGVEMDPYDLGVDTLMQGMDWSDGSAEGGMPDTQRMVEKLKEEFSARVDKKINLLRPVLTDAQLDRYRAELMARGGGFLDQMIMGLEISDQVRGDAGQ